MEEDKDEKENKDEEASSDNMDKILTDIGMGRWHVLIFVINISIWSVLGPHTMGSTLYNAPVDFLCFNSSASACAFLRAFEHDNETVIFDSKCLSDDESLPIVTSDKIDFFCSYSTRHIGKMKTTDNLHCPYVLYDTSVFTDTVATDWDLICDSLIKRPLFQNSYSVGIIIGCFLVGPISDNVGRAKAMTIGTVFHLLSSSLVIILPSFSLVLIARLVVGASNLLILISAVTHAIENCPVSLRGPVGTFVGLPYSIWIIVFGAAAYYIRNWCYLYISVSFPALFLLPAIMALDESPRWLMQQGKETQAYTILLNAAKKNKASNETIHFIIRLRDKAEDKDTFDELGPHTPRPLNHVSNSLGNSLSSIHVHSCIIPFPIDVNNDVVESKYGTNEESECERNFLSSESTSIADLQDLGSVSKKSFTDNTEDPKKLSLFCKKCATKSSMLWRKVRAEIVPFFATRFMRQITISAFCAKLLCEFVYYGVFFNSNNFGSENPFLYVCLSGLADAAAVIIGVITSKTVSRKITVGGSFFVSGIFLIGVTAIPKDFLALQWIGVLSGFLMIAVASQTFYVYLPELFPTTLRGKGFATCNLAGNIGILFAPLVADILGEAIWWGPGVFLGLNGICGSFLILLLPETKDRKLCENVLDVEKRGYGKQK